MQEILVMAPVALETLNPVAAGPVGVAMNVEVITGLEVFGSNRTRCL